MILQKNDQFSWKSQFFVFRSFRCMGWHIGINCCGIYTGASALPTIGMNTLWLYSLSFKWKVKTWFWDEFWKHINFLRNHHVGISFFLLIYDVYNDVRLCLGPLWDIFHYYAFIFGHFWQILQNFDDLDKNLPIYKFNEKPITTWWFRKKLISFPENPKFSFFVLLYVWDDILVLIVVVSTQVYQPYLP